MSSLLELGDIFTSVPFPALQSFLLHVPVPAGIIEPLYNSEGVPIDVRFLCVSEAYCRESPLVQAFWKEEDGTGAVFGRTLIDMKYPPEKAAEDASMYQAILQEQKKRELKIHFEGIDYVIFIFPISEKYCGFMHNIRKEAEVQKQEVVLQRTSNALQVAEQRFQKLMDSNILGIIVGKLNGEIDLANDRFFDIVGAKRSDYGETKLLWSNFTLPTYTEFEAIKSQEFLSNGFCSPFERDLIGRNEELIPVELASCLGETNAEDYLQSTYICYIIDLRERKKAEQSLIVAREDAIKAREEAIAASKAKSNFLSTMSHELRTPLAGILGAQTLLMDTNLDREQKELVEASIRSGQGLLSLLGDVLDLSKIEAGRVTLNMSTFDLRQAICDSVALVGELACKKGLSLVTYFDESIEQAFEALNPPSSKSQSHTMTMIERSKRPLMVQSDMQRLRQIIINLVGNSIKFTDAGGILVKISCMPKGMHLRRPSWNSPIEVCSPLGPDSESLSAQFKGEIRSRRASLSPCAPPSLTRESSPRSVVSAPAASSPLLSPFGDFGTFSSASPPLTSHVLQRRPSDVSFVSHMNNDIPISADSYPDDDDVLRILVEVKDTGIGVPKAKQKTLFQPFSQVDASATRRFEGAGLGLSICKQLLTLLGGSIGLVSQDTGSNFFFDLPLKLAPTFEQSSQPAAAQVSSSIDLKSVFASREQKHEEAEVPHERDLSPSSSFTIDPLKHVRCLLVVSRDTSLCGPVVFLKKNNFTYSTVCAEDEDALETIKSQSFDILILCLHATFQPALALMEKLAQDAEEPQSRWQHFPIVVLGFRDGIAARRKIRDIQNLKNVVTSYKPVSEHRFLDCMFRAYCGRTPVPSDSFSSPALPQVSVASDSSHADDDDDVPLELYRMENHIAHSLAQSLRNQSLSSPLSNTQQPTFRRASVIHLEEMAVGERPEASALLSNVGPDIVIQPPSPPSPMASSIILVNGEIPSLELSPTSPSSMPVLVPYVAELGTPPIAILLCEDNPLISKIARKQIETKLKNVCLQSAENGQEAVECAEAYMRNHGSTIPLIFMDIMMPVIDGLEATREIRRLELARGFGSSSRTRSYIIALTADNSADTVAMCQETGMDEFVSKPMTVPTLLAVFEKIGKLRATT